MNRPVYQTNREYDKQKMAWLLLRVFPAKDVTTAGILCFFKKRTLFT
jgi:hypothetical protein